MADTDTPAQDTPKAGDAVTLESLQGTAQTAYEDYIADPTDETKGAFEAAFKTVGEWKAPPPLEPEEPPKPPEKYELTLADDTVLDPSTVDEIASYAKERGLSNEAAQEILSDREKFITADREAQQEAQMEEVEEARKQWAKDAEADKEIGGKEFKKTAALANRVIERFGSKEFKKAMDDTGFGNHPEVLRIFRNIGTLLTDDQLILPKDRSTSGEKTVEDTLYDHPSSQASKAG